MYLNILTIGHVIISLAGIFSGLYVLFGLLTGKRYERCTTFFLATTVATSATGFLFPVHQFMPSHAVGILSLIVLGLAIYARSSRQLHGGWRKVFVICSVLALYLNVFVAIVQSFQKIPALKALAPTQSEPPFKVTQLVILILAIVLGVIATIRFKDKAAAITPLREA